MTDGTMLWGGEHQGSGSGEGAEFGLGLVECEVVRSGSQVGATEQWLVWGGEPGPV